MKFSSILCAALLLAGGHQAASAQQPFPNRPVRIIVPYPAGETLDVIARLIAQQWSPLLGQQIIVDNRAGGGGMVGTALGAQATPDGYNLLAGNVGALVIIPSLQAKPAYTVLKDFTPISQISSVPFFIYVSPAALPAASLKDLVAYAKEHPGKINYASTGIGSAVHLAGELFKTLAKIDIVHVPYKGVGQAIPDLVSGKIQMVFYPPTFLSFVRDGKLRAVAITASERSPLLPDVPTTAESGMPELLASSWHAILAPAGIPPERARKLSQTLSTVMADKAVRDRIVSVGADPVGSSPEAFDRFLRAEVEKWRNVIRFSGVSIEQ